MATIKEYLDYVELAQASYSDLSVGIPNISSLIQEKKAEFSEKEAKAFAERYAVKAVYNDPNGFSATLFQETKTGKLILSLRGTSDYLDFDDDAWLTTGKLPPQYESMITFFKTLTTENDGKEAMIKGSGLNFKLLSH